MKLLFSCHGYSLCRAYLRTYPAAFAIFQIYLDGHGFADYGFWAIEPAQKTDTLILLGWQALFLVYDGKGNAPLACLACFANSR